MFTEGTDVLRHHLGTGVRTDLTPIGHAVRVMRGLGVSASGSALVIANASDGGVLRIPLSPESWSRDVCLRAGRSGTADDLLRAGFDAQALIPGCS